MSAYLIVYGADPTDRLAAYAFNDTATGTARAHARAASLLGRYVPRVPPEAEAGGCAYVIETEADVTFGGALLIAVYNGLTGESVNRFETRTAGVHRLFEKLPTVATVVEAQPQQEDQVSEAQTQTTAHGGRRERYRKEQIVELLVSENPKKPGKKNYDRFATLMSLPAPRTIEAVTAAGIPLGDVAYDVEHGFVRVVDPSSAVEEAA